MRTLLWDVGLKQKFAMSATLVVALIACFIALFFPRLQERQMKADLEDKARALVEMAARSSTAGLLFEDVEAVTSGLQGLTELDDVAFVEVFRESGAPFYSYQATGADSWRDLTSVDPPTATKVIDRGEVWVAATPLTQGATRLGYMTLGLTTDKLARKVEVGRRLAILVGGATLLISFTTFWLLASRIVVPLRAAVGVAYELASGNPARPAPGSPWWRGRSGSWRRSPPPRRNRSAS